MKDNYINARSSVYNINYRIVWCVRYRQKLLHSPIVPMLKEILVSISEEKGFCVQSVDVCEEDHVICIVSAHPKLSVTDIVKYLKGISARRLLIAFPEIKEQLNGDSLWNGSYFVESLGSESEEYLSRYIKSQKSSQM